MKNTDTYGIPFIMTLLINISVIIIHIIFYKISNNNIPSFINIMFIIFYIHFILEYFIKLKLITKQG